MRLAAPITTDASAPLARTNPLARIGAAALLMGALFAALDAMTAGLILLVVVVSVPFLGISAGSLLRRAWPLLGAAVLIGLLNALFGVARGPVVVAIGPVELHGETLVSGASLGVRILAIALAGIVALASADPTEVADALVQELHVAPRFALGALAALRLVPILAEEWQLLGLARRARGVTAGSPLGWLRLQVGRLLSMLVVAIRRAVRLALAMEARGLGSRRCRTAARPQRMHRRDWALLAGAAIAGAAATWISLVLGTYRFLLG